MRPFLLKKAVCPPPPPPPLFFLQEEPEKFSMLAKRGRLARFEFFVGRGGGGVSKKGVVDFG